MNIFTEQKLIKEKFLIIENYDSDPQSQLELTVSACEFLGLEATLDGSFLVENHNHPNLDMSDDRIGFTSSIFWDKVHIDLPPAQMADGLACLVSMNMKKFTCDPGAGNTFFLNMCKAFHSLGVEPDYLSDLRISFCHDDSEYVSPIVFNHYCTGEPVLFWPKSNASFFSGDAKKFDSIKSKILKYIKDENNWYEHQWKVNDLVLFDNTSMLHSFSSGWTKSQRFFNQAIAGYYVPNFFVKGKDIWKSWNTK